MNIENNTEQLGMKRKDYNPPIAEVMKPYGLSLLASLSYDITGDLEGFEDTGEWQ